MTRTRRMTSLASAATAGLLLTACGGVSDDDRQRAEDAALQVVGDGRVTEVSEADGDETAAYDVEVSLDTGESIDVELDEDFGVLNEGEVRNELSQAQPSDTPSATPGDDADDQGDDQSDDRSDDQGDGGRPAGADDDTPLRGEVKRQAERAALAEVGGGRVSESTYADSDERHVYEVEVEQGSGDDDDVSVDLDADFGVVRVDR